MSRTNVITLEQLNEAAMSDANTKKDPFSGRGHRLDEGMDSSPPPSGSSESGGSSSKWATATAVAGTVAAIWNTPNPFSSTGDTFGGAAKKYIINPIAKYIAKKWKERKEGGAQKTTKNEGVAISTADVRKFEDQVKQDQAAQAAQRLLETDPEPTFTEQYEEESIRQFEAKKRAAVPWILPNVDEGITRMTGFEPFTATADQTFNIFYGGGHMDPFLRG